MTLQEAIKALNKYFENKKSQGELSVNDIDLYEAFQVLKAGVEGKV